jgi:hypothetical protein
MPVRYVLIFENSFVVLDAEPGLAGMSVLTTAGEYRGTQLDGLSAGYTIRVNGYVPCLTEFISTGSWLCTPLI